MEDVILPTPTPEQPVSDADKMANEEAPQTSEIALTSNLEETTPVDVLAVPSDATSSSIDVPLEVAQPPADTLPSDSSPAHAIPNPVELSAPIPSPDEHPITVPEQAEPIAIPSKDEASADPESSTDAISSDLKNSASDLQDQVCRKRLIISTAAESVSPVLKVARVN